MSNRPGHWADLVLPTNDVRVSKCRDCEFTVRSDRWGNAKKMIARHWVEHHYVPDPVDEESIGG